MAPLTVTSGQLPAHWLDQPHLAVDPACAIATCFKPSDDGVPGRAAVRLWQTGGQAPSVWLHADGYKAAKITDLLEREQSDLSYEQGSACSDTDFRAGRSRARTMNRVRLTRSRRRGRVAGSPRLRLRVKRPSSATTDRQSHRGHFTTHSRSRSAALRRVLAQIVLPDITDRLSLRRIPVKGGSSDDERQAYPAERECGSQDRRFQPRTLIESTEPPIKRRAQHDG